MKKAVVRPRSWMLLNIFYFYNTFLQKSGTTFKTSDDDQGLGLLIYCSLSWKYHIEHIVVKISRLVGIIAKHRHFVPPNTLLHIYQSLILPYISYWLTAWGLASKSCLTKILILQKRAIRFYIFQREMNMLSVCLLMLILYH